MKVDDAHDIAVVMPIYNLMEYSDNSLKKVINGDIADFNAANAATDSFKNEAKNSMQEWHKNFEIMVSQKNHWRTPEMPLINFEISFDLNWSENWVIVASNEDQAATFSITDTKLYVPVVTLSTQDNTNLLEQ